MLCDACNVRPGWQGEHRCHAPSGEGEPKRTLSVQGQPFVGHCECQQCRVPTKAEVRAMLRQANALDRTRYVVEFFSATGDQRDPWNMEAREVVEAVNQADAVVAAVQWLQKSAPSLKWTKLEVRT